MGCDAARRLAGPDCRRAHGVMNGCTAVILGPGLDGPVGCRETLTSVRQELPVCWGSHLCSAVFLVLCRVLDFVSSRSDQDLEGEHKQVGTKRLRYACSKVPPF